MSDKSDYDVLSSAELARRFEVTERTMRRWISGGYFPRPTMFGRQQGWRWGQIRRWMQATEFLQGLGITRLIPPDDDETVVEEDNASTGMDATGGHPRTPTGHLRTSGDIGPTSSSGNKKRG